jgi:hypothetical protein
MTFFRLFTLTASAALALDASCARSDRQLDAAAGAQLGRQTNASPSLCPPAPNGIIVSFDKVAYFPARARMSELERLCPAAGDTLYDAVGWQAAATKLPFIGATLVAIHSGNQPDDQPDMWTASGDSLRLPDGQLLSRTLGALRALGRTSVDDNEGYDDWNGPDARTCRFPEILFKLDGTNLPKTLPDSTRVIGIEINVAHRETMASFCSADYGPPKNPPRPPPARPGRI